MNINKRLYRYDSRLVTPTSWNETPAREMGELLIKLIGHDAVGDEVVVFSPIARVSGMLPFAEWPVMAQCFHCDSKTD
jgi:hypothetical protein